MWYRFYSYDYTVTIPNPDGDYSKNKEDSDFPLELDYKMKPVIILFGWAGSSDKNLSVYSRIYEAKGLMTIRVIVSMKSVFLWKHHIYPISDKMVEVVENLNIGGHPIFVHCFSNGGSYLYHFFKEAVRNSKKPIIIKGVIFDSAPSRRTIGTAFRAIRPNVIQNPFLNLPLSAIIFMIYIGIWIIEILKRDVFRREVIQFKPMDYLLEENNECPQHFIYSKCDKVVPSKDVEFFMGRRMSLGVDVSFKCYEDTQHVKHYPFKKYTYTQSIFNFMSKCLDLDSSMV